MNIPSKEKKSLHEKEIGSLIEAILDPVFKLNAEGRITDINQAALNITGFNRNKIKGTDLSEYFTSPDRANEIYKEVFGKGISRDTSLTLRNKDGQHNEVVLNGSTYKDDKGNIQGAILVARITTKKGDERSFFQDKIKGECADEVDSAHKELKIENIEKENQARELTIANKKLALQNDEKVKRADELSIANKELAFQNDEKGKRADELIIANKELAYQDKEKEKRAAELIIANKELAYQNKEKEKRAEELSIANKELLYQNQEKENRAAELRIANEELAYQNELKEKRAAELSIANKELAYQNELKEKRARELSIANKELAVQNELKEKRAAELIIANKELAFQNDEKEKRAAELIIANKELAFQNEEKEKRAAELIIANEELVFQNEEKLKRAAELRIANYARGLIEASRDPLITISPEGKITDMNQATAHIIGLSREKLTGTDFFEYFTEPQKAREVYEEVFAKGSVSDSPLTIRHKDGKLTDVLFNGSVYKDDRGNVLGVVVVARDITDQKRFENELIEAKSKAEQATKLAEDAVKAKQQFLSNMSHEIRTPMNAIIGFTKVLLKTELTDKQDEYLTAIKVSGDALIVLINDILDLAKVDAGKMTFEQTPFKLSASIYAMLHLFETKIQEKNLVLVKKYDPKIPEVLIGDPVRLHQVILNLVSNAIKFTSEGKITVSTKLVDEDKENAIIEFSVSDTGIGIPESKLANIFDDFQQATSGTSRLYGGTGLGLAIVKSLVEPQGGTIRVKSKVGEGSTFSFVLTFKKTKAKAETETEMGIELQAGMKNVKILVVEDIALNQLLMRTLLEDFGFDMEIAGNGKIAIEKLREKDFDLILMDLQMPVMNGFDATEYIRNTLHSQVPIIALTADVTTVDVDKCKAVGMNDYLSKPIDDKLLYAKIIKYLKQCDKNDDLKENGVIKKQSEKCINMDYLQQLTKNNRERMKEMIEMYIEETPQLINTMKVAINNKDWDSLRISSHSIIPFFSTVGLGSEYEKIARKLQEYGVKFLDENPSDDTLKETTNILHELLLKIETICLQSCNELQCELISMVEKS